MSNRASTSIRPLSLDMSRSPPMLPTHSRGNSRILPPIFRPPLTNVPETPAPTSRGNARMTSPIGFNLTTAIQAIHDARDESQCSASPRILKSHLTAPADTVTPRPSVDQEDATMPTFDSSHFDICDMMNIPHTGVQAFYSPSQRLKELEEEEKAIQREKEILTAQVTSKNNNWAVLHHQEVESRKITPSSTIPPSPTHRYHPSTPSPQTDKRAFTFDISHLPFVSPTPLPSSRASLPPSLLNRSPAAVNEELDHVHRSFKALNDETQTVGQRYRIIGELHTFLDDDEEEDPEADTSDDPTRSALVDLLVECIASRMAVVSSPAHHMESAKSQLHELEGKLNNALKSRQSILKRVAQKKRLDRTATLPSADPLSPGQFPRFT